jgi:undecaprenyl-diphosphatase
MTDALLAFDEQLLLLINGSHTPFLDELMWIFSAKWINLPLAVLILAFLKSQFSWRKTSIIFLLMLLVVAMTDLVSTQLFKDYFQRLRPSHDPQIGRYLHYYLIDLNNPYIGGRYGFVSSHAANLAGLLGFLFPYLIVQKRVFYLLLSYVFIVCYSRIYLGVHYPTDIICGALLGVSIAFLARKYAFNKILEKLN